MSDEFSSKATELDSPPRNAVAVTPSNSTDLANTSRALWIGVSGDVKVDMAGSGTVTYSNVPVGRLSGCFKRVYATGTTATSILAEW